MARDEAYKRISRKDFIKGIAAAQAAIGLAGAVGAGCAPAGPASEGTAEPTTPAATPTPVVIAGANEVLIGAPYPLTGSHAVGAWQIVEGIRLAVDLINFEYPDYDVFPFAATAGLPNHDGAQLRLLMPDTQGLPENCLADTERLITQDNVNVVFGGYASSLSAVVSEVAERYEIPYVAGAPSSPSLGERGFKWFFRQEPHDIIFTASMFQFLEEIKETLGIDVKTLGIIYEDSLFGADSAEQMRIHADKYGYEVVEDLQYQHVASSLLSEVQRLKSSNPDCVMPTSYTEDAILFVQTCKELDYVPPLVVAQDAGFTDAFFEPAAMDAEGFITRAGWAPDSPRQIVQTLQALFTERTGREISDPGAKGFQSFMTLADALNRAASFEPEDIRQALLETDIPIENSVLPFGVKFDPETGENTLCRAVMWQMHEGVYRTVWPEAEAIADVMYPIPPWSER